MKEIFLFTVHFVNISCKNGTYKFKLKKSVTGRISCKSYETFGHPC